MCIAYTKANVLLTYNMFVLQGEKTALVTKNPGKQDICESEKVFCNSNI